MKTLGASIVQRGIASVSDVEEALARQVMYGGDLATNLLELASVKEEELTKLLAHSHGMPPAPTGELPVASDGVRRLVPGDMAFRHGLYPLFEREGKLTIAVAEPLAQEVEQDLSFALGVAILQLAAPLVRIHQAVARDYQKPLDPRTDRIIARLTGQPASLSEPPRIDVGSLPHPETLPPSAYASDSDIDVEAQTGPPPLVYPISGPTTEQLTELQSAGAPNDTEREGSAPYTPAPGQQQPTEAAVVASSPAQAAPLSRPSRPAAEALGTAARELARDAKSGPPKPHRRLGPYTAADAEGDLMNAETRDDIVDAFFSFAAQYFEYCALFVVHSDLAEGRDARGPGASPEEVRTLGIPLDVPSAIASVNETRKWLLVRLTGGGIDAGLAKDLKRQSGPQCLLLPIIMRERCVLILYGDHGHADVSLTHVGDVISFAPLVAAALQRVILKRKRSLSGSASDTQLPVFAQPLRRSQVPLPKAEDRARALASALKAPAAPERTPTGGFAQLTAPGNNETATQVASGEVHGRQSGSRNTPPLTSFAPTRQSLAPPYPLSDSAIAPVQEGAKLQATEPPQTVPSSDLALPHGESSAQDSGLSPAEAVSGRDEAADYAYSQHGESIELEPDEEFRTSVVPLPVLSIEPPEYDVDQGLDRTLLSPRPGASTPGLPEPDPSSLLDEPPEDGWDIESRKHNLREPSAPNRSTASAASEPEINVGSEEMDRELRDVIARDQSVPLAPASRSVSYSARPPKPSQNSAELRLPSVIVDFESDCRALVQRLCAGDLDAGDQLVAMGPSAVSALVAKFPGPIEHDLKRGAGEVVLRASDCGPVLRTLVRIGPSAVPFVVVRTADAQPEVRAWATRVLGELPTRESAYAVARRLVDDNQEVRRAALAAARMHQRDTPARAAIREYLADLASDASRTVEARHAALEALSDIRDAESVTIFIRILNDPNRDLVKSAHWGLTVLTRTDLGSDARPWETWWRNNQDRHRIEWLIDALMHENADIRRAAGDELKNITKEYFGYYDDLPRKERGAAQARYLQWWESKGRSRFD